MKGTGWTTLAAKGIWRPQGADGAHVVDFGLQRDAYQLRSIENATTDWIAGRAGCAQPRPSSATTMLHSLYAQDTWSFAPRWKTVLGARLEHWKASNGQTSNATTTSRCTPRAQRDRTCRPRRRWRTRRAEEWVLKASTGRAVRMPTVSELYQGGVNASGTCRSTTTPT